MTLFIALLSRRGTRMRGDVGALDAPRDRRRARPALGRRSTTCRKPRSRKAPKAGAAVRDERRSLVAFLAWSASVPDKPWTEIGGFTTRWGLVLALAVAGGLLTVSELRDALATRAAATAPTRTWQGSDPVVTETRQIP